MSTAKILKIVSSSSGATEKIGAVIGRQLRGGEVIELISDLGGGKTTLTKGLAKGAGAGDHVSSPTFTVAKLYQGTRVAINHFDFYRLDDPGIVKAELQEAAEEPGSVLVVEWADTIRDILPADRLLINLEYAPEPDCRSVTITYPDSLGYLLERLER